MDVLEPWLASTIEGELGEALRHWEDDTSRHQSTGKSRRLSYDDGSNLRIRSAKKEPNVQITKFLTFTEPIQVILSDSVIRVNASITNQASQRYAESNKKKLTEGTVGGLIQLKDFEIVATHFGPRDKRLTLYVKDFKSIGSNGSGEFGVAPQAIVGRERTKELLQRLAELRKHGLDAPSEQSAAASPIMSQPSTQTSDVGNDQESQAGFATQVPRSSTVSKSKSLASTSTTSINLGSTSTTDSVKSSVPSTNGIHGNPLASTLGSLQVHPAPHIPSVDDNKALLDLLRKRKLTPLAPESLPKPRHEQPPRQVTRSSEPVAQDRENRASRLINLAPGDGNASRDTITTQKRKRQSSEIIPRKKASNDYDLQGLDKDRQSLAVNHILENRARSGHAVSEASVDTIHSQPTTRSTEKPANFHPSPPLEHSAHSNTKNASPAYNRSTVRSRISSRDVNIPKDQDTLLNRADSWMPAEPGQREPYANIPISVLKRLNQKAGPHTTKTRKPRNGTITPSAIIDQIDDSESDAPVSSGLWPASPEREQLPPDSSPVSAGQSDHSSQRTMNKPCSASSARRQSSGSTSSHSTPLGQPSPILAKQYSEKSGSPSIASSGASSHPGTSTSASEDVQCFMCQAPGCDKSYKKSSSLKHHVDRRHPDLGSFENFKCPTRNCTNSYASPGGLKYHIERHHDSNSVLSSHSGNATPTTPRASAPMSLGAKNWRDGLSGQDIPESGADDESNGLEVSALVPSILDETLKSPDDEEAARRPSNTDSLSGSKMPLDAPPALIQPVTNNADTTYVAEEILSPPLPKSSTPESDLEMTIPFALNEKTDSSASNAPIQQFPSTASQQQDSFTQVKRTPYADGRVQNESLKGPLFSPLKVSIVNGHVDDDTEFVSASITSGLETLNAETVRGHQSSDTVEDQSTRNVAAIFVENSDSQELTDSNAKRFDKVQQGTSEAEFAADKPDVSSLVTTESHHQSSVLPTVVTDASISNPAVPESLVIPDDSHTDRPPQLATPHHSPKNAHQMKRKIVDLSFISPSVTKRQKRFKVPSAFTFIERSDVPRDPSLGARQYRQDFLASRRSSESSTPTMSPIMPFAVSPGNTPENPRDPLERARQIRQEFIASRRNSDTSTPTRSPKPQFTALTETIQTVCRNVEVEKSVDLANLQHQSTGAEIRQETTESEDLSARSQTQGWNLNAAPLPNGTPFRAPDSDAVKPGAQDASSPSYEADSSMFVAQDADVETPDAERRTVIEASSNTSHTETQRAHPAPKDARHDQVANKNEEGQSVEPKSDEARYDSPPRADEVAEPGSNLPTPIVVLGNVTQPEIPALESIHQQFLIEENLDTQMPDRSEGTPQQRSFAVDANAPMSDDIASKPTSLQQMIGVDTNGPMPVVQVCQDIASSEPVNHVNISMNQTTPISSPVPAFVAKSRMGNQPHSSPTASDPAIPLGKPVLDAEVKPFEKQQDTMQVQIETTKQNPLSVPQSIFDKFKIAYPAYPGDMKHFAAICRKISLLVKANRMEHQSLWDDFIIRHKMEYSQYLQRCAQDAEDAVPYEAFYQTEIDGPEYQKRVINRRNLDAALALVTQQTDAEQVYPESMKDNSPRVKPVDQKSTFKSSPVIEKVHHEYAPANNDGPIESVRTNSALKQAGSHKVDRKSFEPPVLIDLTEDDPPDDPPGKGKESGTVHRSSSPNRINNVSVEPPRFQHCRDSSGSLRQVPPTPSPVPGSLVPLPPRPTTSLLVPTTGSPRNTTKSVQRPLPWLGFDHSHPKSSPSATPRDASKRISGSGLREIRPKGSDNGGNVDLQIPAKSTPKGPKQNQRLLNTCHRVIQSNWGIKAHELLEPEYSQGQVWSETMVELLAEIASKVNADEARNQITRAIDSRMMGDARRGDGHAHQDRRILKSDLEVVRDGVVTSSMSTTSPFTPSHTNAVVEKQNEGTPSEWWADSNSPFKSFARAYVSIRPGNGNSFAKAGPTEPGDAQSVHEATGSGVQSKKIDITKWNL